VSARAGIVVTGTEVLTGRVSDRNGPWLSDRLRELGVDLAHLAIVGDRPQDMEAALRRGGRGAQTPRAALRDLRRCGCRYRLR
jgi:molybdopterin-biosynthesis enzyme MoeA-like protein